MISLKAFLKERFGEFWKNRFKILAIVIIAAILSSAVFYMQSGNYGSADISFNYANATNGLNPNSTRMNINEMLSDEFLTLVIERAGLTGKITSSQLASCIEIFPVDINNISGSGDYMNTTYRFTLDTESLGLRNPSAEQLTNVVCTTYREYFITRYSDNRTILTSRFTEDNEKEPYLRLEWLSIWANELNRYIETRVKENKNFKDEASGLGFTQISKSLANIIQFDIPTIRALIIADGVSYDGEALVALLTYRQQMTEMAYERYMAQYEANRRGLQVYNKVLNSIAMIPIQDGGGNFYMAQTKTGLDDMTIAANVNLEQASSLHEEMSYTDNLIERIRNGVGADSRELSELNGMLDRLSGTLQSLADKLYQVDTLFVKHKTMNYITFHHRSESFIQRIHSMTVILIAFAMVVLSYVFFVIRELIRINKRRKGEKVL